LESFIVAGFSLLGLVGDVGLEVRVVEALGEVPSAIVEFLLVQSEALNGGDSDASVVTILGEVFKPVCTGSCDSKRIISFSNVEKIINYKELMGSLTTKQYCCGF